MQAKKKKPKNRDAEEMSAADFGRLLNVYLIRDTTNVSHRQL
jgi:hypothetical protein